MGFVRAESLGKVFAGPDGRPYTVFEDVSFQLAEGEFVAVVGHSGCGKSTLLNILAGLERPSWGRVLVDGKEVRRPGRDRGVVFQSFAVMPWLTVFDNIRLAVEAAFPGWDARQVRRYVAEQIERVGLKGAEGKKPAALSGGMKQRVGLARAFAIQPKVLLLDEPFAQIDFLTRRHIQDELVRLWMESRRTVFMVTHDVDEAIFLSDRILLMSSGPSARIAGDLAVQLPRPRVREQLEEQEEYRRLRRAILEFLARERGGVA